MALVLKDRVKESTTTTGTGTYTLAGAVTGFEAFSSIGNGNTTYYVCTDGTDFEVGIGTYTLSGTTLARTTILESSNSDSAVSWSSGSKTIFCSQPAEKAVFLNASDNLEIAGTAQINGSNGVTISTGAVSIKNSGAQSYVDFYCESSNAHYARLLAPAHSAFAGNITLTLPATTQTLVGTAGATFTGDVTVPDGDLILGSTAVSSTAAELNKLDGATVTVSEINILDGDTSASSTTVVDADRVVFNDAGTMKQVAVTDLAAYFDDEITAMPNLVTTAATTVGALNSGSITSGFGTIDTGSSTITTTGLITGGSLDIDDVVINGTTIGHTDDTDLMTVASGLLTVAGEVSMTTLDIGGTNVTATASELNILDGVTSTAAELNILDGVTSTAAELNILDGVTSTAAELNILDGVTATAAELNYSDTGASVGTVVASKVVTVDANKDVASFRNITLTGELDAGSLDVSGDADIDGTLEADAITVNGATLNSVIADEATALAIALG